MRVLSLGAGVQSTTVLLMSLVGELDPLDAAIFADTKWEPEATYRHVEWLRGECERAGVPLRIVTAGDLRAHVIDNVQAGRNFRELPMYSVNQRGRKGRLHRQCTKAFKVAPIHREIRRLAGMTGKRWKGDPWEQWFGISLDEQIRMRDSAVPWLVNRYPLIERNMTRRDCADWLTAHGFPVPPQSSCIGCPFHNKALWVEMRANRPAEFADAVAFDAAVRTLPRNREGFLHASRQPLELVNLKTPEERGQVSMFEEECQGVCEL
jgi:hypothetical protein